MYILKQLRFRLQSARYLYWDGRSILASLQHQKELSNLVQWAQRKRLTKQRRHYQSWLFQIEEALFWRRYRNRTLYVICQLLFEARRQLFSPSRYHRGSAARYRTR